MPEERLLERLRSRTRDPGRRSRSDLHRAVDSVLSHLQRILNTHVGSVPIAADFGVPDFTDALRTYPDSVREIERALRQMIQKYEPRLSAVRVQFLPADEDLLTLRFQISAQLLSGNQRQSVSFESRLDTDGRIEVKR